ncbi:MAG: SGNH/GDSL hydrolase family protein, partial [Chloroflexota bacterium]
PATSTPTRTPKPPLAKDAWMQMPAVPAGVSDAMREVYQRGLALGNDPTHFSVIGDCQNVSSYFLSVFDKPGEYSLGEEYAYLQPTIDYYQGSFSRVSVAVKGGFNAAAVISPLRSDPKVCNANESPLDCELRLWRPSVVIVSMETWWSQKPEQEYEKYMRRVLDRILETGAVPIIATKADNLEGDHAINATIAQLAYEYDIPLWNFWAAVQPLPHHGLSSDGFHLTFARNFFDDPARMKSAWPWRNLTALQTLDVVRRGLTEAQP